MRRPLAALAAALAVSLSAGTSAAIADTQTAGATQGAEQVAGTGQSATSSATSTQYKPSNSAISVRIGSPGNGGSVSQSNSSAAGSAAGNLAATSQDATQAGAGGGTQAAGQQAYTGQSAASDATSTQAKPSNSAISVRIGSGGNDGDVTQSNESKAVSLAGNAAKTTQTADQQGGAATPCGCSSGGTQAAAQKAVTKQDAQSDATSTQDHPSNSAISVRIGSPGNDGDVDQHNSSKAVSLAGNAAKTTQTATQDQGSGSGTQALEQKAATKQDAESSATSTQYKPSNSAISVRIGSGGNGGSVSQSNDSTALSAAGNLAATKQDATQDAHGSSCGCGRDAVQAAGQFAFTGQSAESDATSKQIGASNTATGVRIGSPGNDGDVEQSNTSAAGSFAGNAALTSQTADQEQAPGHGAGVQALEQDAATWQHADSSADSLQVKPTNSAIPVRIGSGGSGGSVSQSNDSAALSAAGNLALTKQDATQDPAGGGCGCAGNQVQAIGQFAWTGQSASSHATSKQIGASNTVAPVGIGKGKGGHDSCGCDGKAAPVAPSGGGDVSQSNSSAALSAAGNLALTHQRAGQSQGPSSCGCDAMKSPHGPSPYGSSSHASSCGCGSDRVQAVGQFAKTAQWADSSATSEQFWPSNTASPVRIGSPGSDGDVEQSNSSLAKSLAFNLAFTHQEAAQRQ